MVQLNNLARFKHRTSRPSTNFKLQPFTLQHQRELASITPIPFTLAYRLSKQRDPIDAQDLDFDWRQLYERLSLIP